MLVNILNRKVKPHKDTQMSNQFLQLKVKEVIRETKDAITIVFEEPSPSISYQSGQFFTFLVPIGEKKLRRPYSLCTSPYVDELPAVTVKRVQGGEVSNYLNDHLRAGAVLEAIPPTGNFTTTYKKENKRHLILLGGGSGITPLIAILKSALHQEPHTLVSLIYANKDVDSIIFNNQLDQLQLTHTDRFKLIYSLDKAPPGWQGITGMLNPVVLKETLKVLPDWGKDKTEYFICGPTGFMNLVTDTLQSLEVPQEKVYQESFFIDNDKATNAAQEKLVAREVTVIYEGETYKFTVPPDKTILETALENDIDLPFSCQSGVCTACLGKCLSGKIKLEADGGLSEEELKEGYVLTCVSHPLTENVVVEID